MTKRENVKKLRENQTETEKRLWNSLRNRGLENFKFRRQAPIGPYVVDFFCPEKNLIVELDGGQHSQNSADEKRTQWLETSGYKVIRFWNNEVLENLEGILIKISENLNHPLT